MALLVLAGEVDAVGPAHKGPAATLMRSGEREQNSPRQNACTRQPSARARPIALGVELTARGGAGSSGMLIGSYGWQHGAGARTGRAGERPEQALASTDRDLR